MKENESIKLKKIIVWFFVIIFSALTVILIYTSFF